MDCLKPIIGGYSTPPNFTEKTFVDGSQTSKSAKIFSLESFPLYGTWTICLHTCMMTQHFSNMMSQLFYLHTIVYACRYGYGDPWYIQADLPPCGGG